MAYPTNGLKWNPTTGYSAAQLNTGSNLYQSLQGYMPQTLAANGPNGGFGPQDYSVIGGTKVPQMDGFNVSNLAAGAGGYNMTNPNGFGGGLGTAPAGGNWYDGAFGKDGWGGLALNAATGLAGTYLGLKQYGLAKDMFAENKSQYAQNFDAQRGLTNSRLEDRQTRRNIERPDSMAAADYMSKYGVK